MIPQIRTDVFLFRLRVAFIEGYVHAIPESFLRRHGNHTEKGFCSNMGTVISARFL